MTIEEYREHIQEQYKLRGYNIDEYCKGESVQFNWFWDEEPRQFTGDIKIIDFDGGGICFGLTPSFDIECDGNLYKHVSIVDVEKAL